MHIAFASAQLEHAPGGEMHRGRRLPPFERPERAEKILAALKQAELGPLLPADDFGPEPLARVHEREFLDFLAGAFDCWQADGGEGDLTPHVWPARTLQRQKRPDNFYGQLGYYSIDAGTPITAGT